MLFIRKRNDEIRTFVKKSNLYMYEVAEGLGIADNTFHRLLRQELSEDKKKEILDVVETLKKKQGKEMANI